MSKRRIALVLCIIAAGGAAGGLAWQRLSRVTAESDPTAYWRQKSAEAYSKFDTVPIRDAQAVRNALEAATVEDVEGALAADSALLDPLPMIVAEFLTTRLNTPSSAEYVSWMESKGYRFRSPEDFAKAFGPIKSQANNVGLNTADIPTLFHAMWLHEPARRGTPDAVCTGAAAMTVAIGHGDRNHFTSQGPSGLLGEELWHGGSGATCRFWMRPPISRAELVERDGEAVCAQFAVIASVPGSARRPLIVNMFLEPRESKWWIDGVSVMNYIGTNEAWTCAEY